MTAPRLASPRRPLARWGLPGAAIVGAGLALIATIAKAIIVGLTGGDIAFLMLVAALAVSARLAGPAAGATTVVVGAALDAITFLAPIGSVAVDDPAVVVRVILFIPTGLFIAFLVGQLGDAERRAQDAAARWNTLLDRSPDATLLTRLRDGTIVYASDRWAELGWPRDRLLGQPIARLLPGQAASLTADEAGEPLIITLDTPDGRDVPVELVVAEVDLDADGPGLLVSARDASERMATQNRLLRLAKAERSRASELAAVIASIDDPVAVIDGDGSVVLANDALGDLSGGPVRDLGEVRRVLGLPADASLDAQDGAVREVRLESSGRWLEVRALPIADDGDDESRLVIARDVTKDREAQVAREAFIGVLSHELRTPITTILGLSTLLNRSTSTLNDEQRKDVVADVAAEAERLHHLVEDLLVLSRAERSELRLDPEPVLLRHALDRVVEADRRRFPHIRFVVTAPPGLPPVAGDRTFVDQVLRNLVGNAAKYSPLSPSTVEVLVEREGDELSVRVLDEGPGFDPADSERLFELFFRSDRTAKQRAGAGIGLYVTRSLVRVMGGRVWARLRDEGGSEFGFALPIITVSDGETRRGGDGDVLRDEQVEHAGSGAEPH